MESLTIDVTVKSANYTINIPKASKVEKQKEIGNFSSHKIKDGIATLFVLAPNHNIIESILYDRRQSPATVYFIQTYQEHKTVRFAYLYSKLYFLDTSLS